MSGTSGSPAVGFRGKRVIVASVGVGPFVNRGNALIDRSTVRALGLPDDTPRFSVFESIDSSLLRFINQHDFLIVTGCTTLQDDPDNQRCFDAQFEKITIPRLCFAGTFYCEPEDRPSLRIAKLFDAPVATRDPWATDYLRGNGIDCEFVGCPTLLDAGECRDWKSGHDGYLLVSSTPSVDQHLDAGELRRARYVAHDARAPGEDLLTEGLFDGAAAVVTSRLHAALPAIARGTRVRFFNPRLSGATEWGSNRHTLLEYLGIPMDGREATTYPARQLAELRASSADWIRRVTAGR